MKLQLTKNPPTQPFIKNSAAENAHSTGNSIARTAAAAVRHGRIDLASCQPKTLLVEDNKENQAGFQNSLEKRPLNCALQKAIKTAIAHSETVYLQPLRGAKHKGAQFVATPVKKNSGIQSGVVVNLRALSSGTKRRQQHSPAVVQARSGAKQSLILTQSRRTSLAAIGRDGGGSGSSSISSRQRGGDESRFYATAQQLSTKGDSTANDQQSRSGVRQMRDGNDSNDQQETQSDNSEQTHLFDAYLHVANLRDTQFYKTEESMLESRPIGRQELLDRARNAEVRQFLQNQISGLKFVTVEAFVKRLLEQYRPVLRESQVDEKMVIRAHEYLTAELRDTNDGTLNVQRLDELANEEGLLGVVVRALRELSQQRRDIVQALSNARNEQQYEAILQKLKSTCDSTVEECEGRLYEKFDAEMHRLLELYHKTEQLTQILNERLSESYDVVAREKEWRAKTERLESEVHRLSDLNRHSELIIEKKALLIQNLKRQLHKAENENERLHSLLERTHEGVARCATISLNPSEQQSFLNDTSSMKQQLKGLQEESSQSSCFQSPQSIVECTAAPDAAKDISQFSSIAQTQAPSLRGVAPIATHLLQALLQAQTHLTREGTQQLTKSVLFIYPKICQSLQAFVSAQQELREREAFMTVFCTLTQKISALLHFERDNNRLKEIVIGLTTATTTQDNSAVLASEATRQISIPDTLSGTQSSIYDLPEPLFAQNAQDRNALLSVLDSLEQSLLLTKQHSDSAVTRHSSQILLCINQLRVLTDCKTPGVKKALLALCTAQTPSFNATHSNLDFWLIVACKCVAEDDVVERCLEALLKGAAAAYKSAALTVSGGAKQALRTEVREYHILHLLLKIAETKDRNPELQKKALLALHSLCPLLELKSPPDKLRRRLAELHSRLSKQRLDAQCELLAAVRQQLFLHQ